MCETVAPIGCLFPFSKIPQIIEQTNAVHPNRSIKRCFPTDSELLMSCLLSLQPSRQKSLTLIAAAYIDIIIHLLL